MSAGHTKSGKKTDRAERNRIYGHALPIVLPVSGTRHVLGIEPFRTADVLKRPQVLGVFDVTTQSVWVLQSSHARLLWERGFFGKGSLSRSEPTWLARHTAPITSAGVGGEFLFDSRQANLTFSTIYSAGCGGSHRPTKGTTQSFQSRSRTSHDHCSR